MRSATQPRREGRRKGGREGREAGRQRGREEGRQGGGEAEREAESVGIRIGIVLLCYCKKRSQEQHSSGYHYYLEYASVLCYYASVKNDYKKKRNRVATAPLPRSSKEQYSSCYYYYCIHQSSKPYIPRNSITNSISQYYPTIPRSLRIRRQGP